MRPILARLNAGRTLSSGKVGILRRLAEGDRATISQLANAIRVSPQGASLAVRELESLGFVERVADEVDRRKVWIDLTEAGRARLDEDSQTATKWMEQVIADQLTAKERGVLEAAVPVLRRIGAATGDVVDIAQPWSQGSSTPPCPRRS